MHDEGWSDEVIKNNVCAYRYYRHLLDKGVAPWIELAEQSNPTQLMTMARSDKPELTYYAAAALKKDKKVTSTKKLKGYLGGHLNNKFEPSCRRSSPPKRKTTSETPVFTNMSPEERDRYNEMKRLGVSQEQYQHLENLVANDNLSLIKDIKTAHTWHTSSVDACLAVIEQELQVRGKHGCAVELRLREILHNFSDRLDREVRNESLLNSILS